MLTLAVIRLRLAVEGSFFLDFAVLIRVRMMKRCVGGYLSPGSFVLRPYSTDNAEAGGRAGEELFFDDGQGQIGEVDR